MHVEDSPVVDLQLCKLGTVDTVHLLRNPNFLIGARKGVLRILRGGAVASHYRGIIPFLK